MPTQKLPFDPFCFKKENYILALQNVLEVSQEFSRVPRESSRLICCELNQM